MSDVELEIRRMKKSGQAKSTMFNKFKNIYEKMKKYTNKESDSE